MDHVYGDFKQSERIYAVMTNLDGKDFKSVTAGSKVLVDFFADWCGECKALELMLTAAEEKTDVPFYRFDCDSDREFVAELGIMSIPTLMLFENGKEKARKIGLCDTDEILDFINR